MSASGVGAGVGGFAKGLSDVLLKNRVAQRQQQQFEEERKDREFQALLPVQISLAQESGDFSGVENFIGQYHPDLAKALKKNAPLQAMGPHLFGRMATPQERDDRSSQEGVGNAVAIASGAQPTLPASPSVTLTAPPPPRATFFGTPVTSPQELTDRKVAENKAIETAKGNATTDVLMSRASALRKLDPTMSVEESLIAVGLKQPADQFAALSPDAGVFNKKTGVITQPAATKLKLPPGPSGDAIAKQLLLNGVVDPTHATNEDIAKAIPGAQAILRKEITDKDQLQALMEEVRGTALAAAKERLDNLPTAVDVGRDAQQITVNGKTYNYVDESKYTGADARNAAKKVAGEAGVVTVSPQQAQQLSAVQATINNLDAYLEQLKPKLPTKKQGTALRLMTGGGNSLATWLKTDDQLAAANTWDTEIVPMIRGLQGTGRPSVQLLATATKARPIVTGTGIDTQESAQQKIDDLKGILGRTVEPFLKTGGSKKPDASVTVTWQGKPYTGTQAQIDAFKRAHPDAK